MMNIRNKRIVMLVIVGIIAVAMVAPLLLSSFY
jgi:capsular polysaccharide biosynthesis protein